MIFSPYVRAANIYVQNIVFCNIHYCLRSYCEYIRILDASTVDLTIRELVLKPPGSLPRRGKRELFFLLSFSSNYVVSVRRGFLFLLVLGMGCVILLLHSLCLSYNYFVYRQFTINDMRFSTRDLKSVRRF